MQGCNEEISIFMSRLKVHGCVLLPISVKDSDWLNFTYSYCWKSDFFYNGFKTDTFRVSWPSEMLLISGLGSWQRESSPSPILLSSLNVLTAGRIVGESSERARRATSFVLYVQIAA